MAPNFTHFDEDGRPRMVDISAKETTERRAVARGRVSFAADAYSRIRAQGVEKGDIRTVAEIAGVMAAKKAADLIPLCHPLSLTSVRVETAFSDADRAIDVTATIHTKGQTGVEMEALTAVAVACLTIYDMAKALGHSMTIGGVELVEKAGGASGDFRR